MNRINVQSPSGQGPNKSTTFEDQSGNILESRLREIDVTLHAKLAASSARILPQPRHYLSGRPCDHHHHKDGPAVVGMACLLANTTNDGVIGTLLGQTASWPSAVRDPN
jgi:hypothetical protein